MKKKTKAAATYVEEADKEQVLQEDEEITTQMKIEEYDNPRTYLRLLDRGLHEGDLLPSSWSPPTLLSLLLKCCERS